MALHHASPLPGLPPAQQDLTPPSPLLPPKQNWLPVRVEAGEQAYGAAHH